MSQTIRDVRALRRRHGLNQQEFFGRVGVTQSGGSRYEAGREMPKPTQTVVHLAYGPLDAAVKAFAKLRGMKVSDLVDAIVGRK